MVGLLNSISNSLYTILFGKGDADMMAMLWANQILMGKKTFSQVPKLLKEKVREILVDAGMEELTME